VRFRNLFSRHVDCSAAIVAQRSPLAISPTRASSAYADPSESEAPSTEEELQESGTFERTTPTTRLARTLRARIVQFRDDVRGRQRTSPFEIPDEVLILPDGAVIASYEGEPLLRYRSLAHLLEQHDLRETDLET
jgi:hypothetical protein